jgi:fructokinase
MDQLYGGVEAGGTKFVCVIGNQAGEISAEAVIQTTDPTCTLGQVRTFFLAHQPLAGLAIASFGPIELNGSSSHYGCLGNVPKPGWAGLEYQSVLASLADTMVFLTDVEAAALAEYHAADSINSLLYMTIGTGIGGARVLNGKIQRGFSHSELGHQRIPAIVNDTFAGSCPYHNNCLEGMASGSALSARFNQPAVELPLDAPVWSMIAKYIAAGLFNSFLTTMPDRIIVGGGVLCHEGLIDEIRQAFTTLNHDYIDMSRLVAMDEYLRLPRYGNRSGARGALLAAAQG